MNNQQILNLSDVDTEDFETIKAAIEDSFNRGVIRGGLVTLAGVWVGAGIYKGYRYFKAKQEEKVE